MTPAGSKYIQTQDLLKACHVATCQPAEGTEELKPSTSASVPHTATPAVAPTTPGTPDKLSMLLLKPSPTALATLAKQPAIPKPPKHPPAAPTPTPVLRWSTQTIVPPKCLITEK